MVKRLLLGVVCLLVLAAVAAFYLWQDLETRLSTPHAGVPAGGVFVEVAPGEGRRRSRHGSSRRASSRTT